MFSGCRHPLSPPMGSRWWCRHGWDHLNPGSSPLAPAACAFCLESLAVSKESPPTGHRIQRGRGSHIIPIVQASTGKTLRSGTGKTPKEIGVEAVCGGRGVEISGALSVTPMPPRPDRGPCQPGLPALGRGQARHAGSRPGASTTYGQKAKAAGSPPPNPRATPKPREAESEQAGGARFRAPIG